MFGINSEVIGLLTNKEKLAQKIKAEAPAVLDGILDLIRLQCGAADGPTAVVFYTGRTASGAPSTMAAVYAVDPFGQPKGEPLGTMDLKAALQAIPNEAITSKLPW